MIKWDCPNPVFFDFETQSAADLKKVGGRLYAEHYSTRILSLVCLIDGKVITWIPRGLFRNCPEATSYPAEIGWPIGHEERANTLWITPELPEPILEAIQYRRTFVGHNVLGFDRFIWREKLPDIPEPHWADTLLLARTAGLPGELDKLAKRQIDQGKDSGKILLKKIMTRDDKTEYLDNHAGTLAGVVRYNIADVLLLEKLWQSFDSLPVEENVIEIHDRINERGIRVDTTLLDKINRVANVSVTRAGEEISYLTDGAITLNNLRSTQQVHKWLNSYGIYIKRYDPGSDGWKASLRKDVVEQALANPWLMLEDDKISVESVNAIPPEIFDVLRLRSAALRITEAKTKKAADRLCGDNTLRDLFSYWLAVTGRWGSSGFQIQNLANAKEGIYPQALALLHKSGRWGNDAVQAYELVDRFVKGWYKKGCNEAANKGRPSPRKITVDDAMSGLLKAILIPAKGNLFAITDFSQIEARVIAWLAGEDKLLDAFREGRDIYCEFASMLFGRLITKADYIERQIGKICILGLGFQMGVKKFNLFCGLSGVNLAKYGLTSEKCVELYRGTYRKICGEQYSGSVGGLTYRRGGLWGNLNTAMLGVINGEYRDCTVGRVRYHLDGLSLVCTLPSSRQIRYQNARIEDRIPPYAKEIGSNKTKATIVYDGPRGESTLYGGKAAENITQGTARDIFALALVRLEGQGIPIVCHEHDGLTSEVPKDKAKEYLHTQIKIMKDNPEWAAGIPIEAEGFLSPRYYKKPAKGWYKV